jgi:hypothetical protein
VWQLRLGVERHLGAAPAEVEEHEQASAQAGAAIEGNFGRANRGARQLGFGIQNAGFQLTDFVVQVGAGTSALRAFTLQAPQLLAGFGPLGVVAGTVTAIAGALLLMRDRTGEAVDRAEALERISDALDTVFAGSKDTLDELITSYRNLTDAQLALEAASARVGQLEVEETILATEAAAAAAVEELQNLIDGWHEFFELGGVSIGIPSYFSEELDPQLQAGLQDLIDTYRETGRVTEELVMRSLELREALGTDAPEDIRKFVTVMVDSRGPLYTLWTVGLDFEHRAAGSDRRSPLMPSRCRTFGGTRRLAPLRYAVDPLGPVFMVGWVRSMNRFDPRDQPGDGLVWQELRRQYGGP